MYDIVISTPFATSFQEDRILEARVSKRSTYTFLLLFFFLFEMAEAEARSRL